VGILFERSQRTQTWGSLPPVPPYLGAEGDGGGSLSSSPGLALQVSAVWACQSLLANSVSMLHLDAFREGPQVPVKLPKQPQILVNPSGNMTQSQWLHQIEMSLTGRGNFFGLVSARDGYAYPTQIDPINPDRVDVRQDDDGRLLFKVRLGKGVSRDVPSADMFHILGLTEPGGVVGLSVLQMAARTISLARSAQKFSSDFFDGGGIPKAVVQSNQQIDQSQAKTIKDRLMAATRNREPITLGDGLTYTAIQVKPEEAQFLATQAYTDTQIARFFGVPPAMIGAPEGSNMTYSNREQRAIDFLTFGVGFWLRRIEDAITSILPANQFVKFDTSALLRTDVETQAKVHVQYLAGKALAPSEVREDLGRPAMTDAQKAEADLVPLTITPLGGAKALPNQPAPGQPAPVPVNDQGAPNA
jgi:HK97 family phage portal protein